MPSWEQHAWDWITPTLQGRGETPWNDRPSPDFCWGEALPKPCPKVLCRSCVACMKWKSAWVFKHHNLFFLRFVWHSRNCFQQSPVLGIKFFKNWKTESLEKWFMTLSKTLQEIREIEIDCPGDVFASRKSQEIRLSNPSQDPKH